MTAETREQRAITGARPIPRRWMLLVLMYALALTTFVLLPLDLAWPTDFRAALRGPIDDTGWSWTTLARWLGHAIAFVPAGVLLAYRRAPRPGVDLVVLVLLAIAGEAAQVFVSRGFSVDDVLCNFGGGVIGYALTPYVRPRRPVSRAIARSLPPTALIALTLLTVALVARPTEWSGWDHTYGLIVGNEATADRPWRGRLLDVAIYDRLLTSAETAALFDGSAWPAGAIARYDFTPGSMDSEDGAVRRVRDIAGAGLGPDLEVTRGRVEAITPHGVHLDDAMLESAAAPRALVARLVDTRAATLVVRFRAVDRAARGPGRMVTISRDPMHRNLMLGQQDGDLHLRVRNRVSGTNGTQPTLVAADVVDPARTQIAIASCAPGESRVVVDGGAAARIMYPGAARVAHTFFGGGASRPLVAGLLLIGFLAFALVFFLLLRGRWGSSHWCEIGAVGLALAALGGLVGLGA